MAEQYPAAPDHLEEDAVNAFLDEFERESDRAAAVLGVAFLDERLRVLLRSKLVPPPLEHPGLGRALPVNYAARVAMAYSAGLIHQGVAADLNRLGSIRNRFAHAIHGLTFDDPAIAKATRELTTANLVEVAGKLAMAFLRRADPDEEITPRQRFNVTVGFLLVLGIERPIRVTPRIKAAPPPMLERFAREAEET